MAIPYTQASMALVRAVDGTYISYPFIESGDTTTKVYNLVCTQRASDYNAAQIDLDDNMSSANNAGVIDLPSGWADSNAYFVGDTGHAPIAGGMISFTRTFANIPQSSTVASGSEFFTFPGIWADRTAGAPIGVTAISMTAGTIGVTLSHIIGGAPASNNIQVSLDYTVGSDPFIYSVNGNFTVLASSVTTTRIDIGHYWNEQVTLNGSGSFVSGDLFRTELSKNVATSLRYDYILPGVTPGISNQNDINLPPPFSVITQSTGEVSNLVSDGDTIDTVEVLETIPNLTRYIDMIEDGKNIVVESSLSEWAGNILVMKTKTCKAQ